MKRILSAILFIFGLTYPIFVYFGLTHFEARTLALFLIPFFLVRFAFLMEKGRGQSWHFAPLGLAILFILLIEVILNRKIFFLFIPALVNFSLLLVFGLSLFRSQSMIETFARVLIPHMNEKQIAYCRNVTLIWCGFFILNALFSLYTAFYASLRIWTLYNGLIAYFLMGLLFVTEFVYRHWRFRSYIGLPTDRLMRKIFPPLPKA